MPRHDAVHGVDGVTIARGAIGNPWVFGQARALAAGHPLPDPPSLFEQRDVIAEHYQIAESLYGADRCVPTMRKFGIKYSQLHPCHKEVRADFCTVRKEGAWRDVLDKWYAEDLPGVHPAVDEPNPVQIRMAERKLLATVHPHQFGYRLPPQPRQPAL